MMGGRCKRSRDLKAMAAFAADPRIPPWHLLADTALGSESPDAFTPLLPREPRPCSQPLRDPWGPPATGEGRGLACSRRLSWQERDRGRAAGLFTGDCRNFPNP